MIFTSTTRIQKVALAPPATVFMCMIVQTTKGNKNLCLTTIDFMKRKHKIVLYHTYF